MCILRRANDDAGRQTKRKPSILLWFFILRVQLVEQGLVAIFIGNSPWLPPWLILWLSPIQQHSQNNVKGTFKVGATKLPLKDHLTERRLNSLRRKERVVCVLRRGTGLSAQMVSMCNCLGSFFYDLYTLCLIEKS